MHIGHLDYKPTTLQMEINNEIEQKWRAFSCAKEPWTVEFIESIPPGSVFWDIGANVGTYSMIAASRGLTTVAIEPGFASYAAMCRNLALNNQLDKVITLCCALGAASGFDWFHYQDTRPGSASHILGGIRNQFFHKQLVPVLAWDELATRLPLPPTMPQYAKVDVDFSEREVVMGGSKTLARMKGLLIEMQTKWAEDIIGALEASGMKLKTKQEHRKVTYGVFER